MNHSAKIFILYWYVTKDHYLCFIPWKYANTVDYSQWQQVFLNFLTLLTFLNFLTFNRTSYIVSGIQKQINF